MENYEFIGTAKNIAYYMISTLPQIDNLKLQKLLYYAQAVHLVRSENKEALFKDQIQAWQYGPVIPDIYHEYKSCGVEFIPAPEQTEDFRIFPEHIRKDAMIFAQESIDMTLEYYGEKSGIELIKLTHDESPWQDVFGPAKKGIEISRQSIYDFYKNTFTFYDEEISIEKNPAVSFVDLKKWVEGGILDSSFCNPKGYYSSWMDYEYMVDLDKIWVGTPKIAPIALSNSFRSSVI